MAAATVLLGVGLGVAAADGGTGAAPTVNCPTVADQLPAVPAQAQAEVTQNLDLLNRQIEEANTRLRTSQGEGGPNFIQNAILGPLTDKRVATINRMATAIGRSAARPQLDVQRLATCTLNGDDAGTVTEPPAPPAAPEAPAEPAPPAEQPAPPAGAGDVPTVNCPAVTGLPAIPAQAQAEVARNLQLLDTQIAEANERLRTSVGQGGPNFIRNAILGPLADKRVATLNRIETAIGRTAPRPEGLERFAPCSLNG